MQPAASAARAEINRQNALRSTGPRTADGKSHSRGNALQHGLTAQPLLLPDADQAALAGFTRRMKSDLQPVGELELCLVESMCIAQFQSERARAIENNLLVDAALAPTPNAMDPAIDYALNLAHAFEANLRTLDLISRYGARHNRQFLQLHDRLTKVQKERHRLAIQSAQNRRLRQSQNLAEHQRNAATPHPQTQHPQPPDRPSGFVPQPLPTAPPTPLHPAQNPTARTPIAA